MIDWLTPTTGRWVNIVLAAVAAVWMCARWKAFASLPRYRRFHWASSAAFVASALFGTLDHLYHISEELRVALVTFSLVWLLAALRFKPRNPTGL